MHGRRFSDIGSKKRETKTSRKRESREWKGSTKQPSKPQRRKTHTVVGRKTAKASAGSVGDLPLTLGLGNLTFANGT